jgi:sRNA-binding regulator protein Hfq
VEEVIKVNRKLIRTTLAEIKGKERSIPERQRERSTNGAPSRGGSGDNAPSAAPPPRPPQQSSSSSSASSSVQVRKRTPPPLETNAELFYYKKQIDAHTPMVIVLQDGEEIEGTIEWYDRGALKVNRRDEPNLLVLKHNIKYMFKQEEREGQKETKESRT